MAKPESLRLGESVRSLTSLLWAPKLKSFDVSYEGCRYPEKRVSASDEGFSLLEVLAVLAIVATLIVYLLPSTEGLQARGFEQELKRLAARVSIAAEQARLESRAYQVEIDDLGYRFYRNQLGRWALVEDDRPLLASAWLASTNLGRLGELEGLQGSTVKAQRLEIGVEPIDPAWELWFSREPHRLSLQHDGFGSITLRRLK